MDFGTVSANLVDEVVAATRCKPPFAEYEANACTATLHCTALGKTTADYVLQPQVSNTRSSSSNEYKHPQHELVATTPLMTDGAELKDDHSDVYDTLCWDLLFQPWPALANAAAAAHPVKAPLITEVMVKPSLVVMPAAAMNTCTHHQDAPTEMDDLMLCRDVVQTDNSLAQFHALF